MGQIISAVQFESLHILIQHRVVVDLFDQFVPVAENERIGRILRHPGYRIENGNRQGQRLRLVFDIQIGFQQFAGPDLHFRAIRKYLSQGRFDALQPLQVLQLDNGF